MLGELVVNLGVRQTARLPRIVAIQGRIPKAEADEEEQSKEDHLSAWVQARNTIHVARNSAERRRHSVCHFGDGKGEDWTAFNSLIILRNASSPDSSAASRIDSQFDSLMKFSVNAMPEDKLTTE
jgi:hypothetical protein